MDEIEILLISALAISLFYTIFTHIIFKSKYSFLKRNYFDLKEDFDMINGYYMKYYLMYKECTETHSKEQTDLILENEALEWMCYTLSSCFTTQVQILHKEDLNCMKCPMFCNGQCKAHQLTKFEILNLYKLTQRSKDKENSCD